MLKRGIGLLRGIHVGGTKAEQCAVEAHSKFRAQFPDWMSGHVKRGDATDWRFAYPKKFGGIWSPQVQRILSLDNGDSTEVKKAEKRRAMLFHQTHELDVGSAAPQVASLTVKINRCAEHCLRFPKDSPSRVKLRIAVARRRRLLLRLRKNDFANYWKIVEDFGLHDCLAPRNPYLHRHAKLYKKGGGI